MKESHQLTVTGPTMDHLDSEDRVAVLLNVLGPEVSGPVLENLPAERVERVRNLLKEMQSTPPADQDVDEVLEEFSRFLRFASEASSHTLRIAPETVDHEDASGASSATTEDAPSSSETDVPPFEPTGDPLTDLQQLQGYQIAGAVRDEAPRTIALVLNCLQPVRAGEVLQYLDDEVRGHVFLLLKDPPASSPAMVERVVRTTVAKGCQLGPEAVVDPQEEADRKLADVLRSMDRESRSEMLDVLAQTDGDAVDRLKKLLYMFEDLLRITNQSVQKILAEIDSATLATALKDADPAIMDKIMGNLSKRARLAMAEEIEFLGSVKVEVREEAREAICEVMARLDQEGDLELE